MGRLCRADLLIGVVSVNDIEQNSKYLKTKAVFLVMCNPSMNEL